MLAQNASVESVFEILWNLCTIPLSRAPEVSSPMAQRMSSMNFAICWDSLWLSVCLPVFVSVCLPHFPSSLGWTPPPSPQHPAPSSQNCSRIKIKVRNNLVRPSSSVCRLPGLETLDLFIYAKGTAECLTKNCKSLSIRVRQGRQLIQWSVVSIVQQRRLSPKATSYSEPLGYRWIYRLAYSSMNRSIYTVHADKKQK